MKSPHKKKTKHTGAYSTLDGTFLGERKMLPPTHPTAGECSYGSSLKEHCSGCTDPQSEGTHQGCTIEHGHIGCRSTLNYTALDAPKTECGCSCWNTALPIKLKEGGVCECGCHPKTEKTKLGDWPLVKGAPCSCGEPTEGVIHRTDGPCYFPETPAESEVGGWREEFDRRFPKETMGHKHGQECEWQCAQRPSLKAFIEKVEQAAYTRGKEDERFQNSKSPEYQRGKREERELLSKEPQRVIGQREGRVMERDVIRKNIGPLRQWLNEKPANLLVTNEHIEQWLGITSKDV